MITNEDSDFSDEEYWDFSNDSSIKPLLKKNQFLEGYYQLSDEDSEDENGYWDFSSNDFNVNIHQEKVIKNEEIIRNSFFKKYNWLKTFKNFQKIGIDNVDLEIIKKLVYDYELKTLKDLFTTKFHQRYFNKYYYNNKADIYHCFMKEESEMLFRVLVGIYVYKVIDVIHINSLYYNKDSENVVNFFNILKSFLSNKFFKEFTNKMIKNNLKNMNFNEKENYLNYLIKNFDIVIKNLRYS